MSKFILWKSVLQQMTANRATWRLPVSETNIGEYIFEEEAR